MTRCGARLFGAMLALALCGWAIGPTKAKADPRVCSVGAYMVKLYDLDTSARTVKAEFWLWSVCPNKDLQPLKTMEFVNSADAKGSLDATLQRGRLWWSMRKIQGSFRQDFSLQNYPFDRQAIAIDMEEGVDDARTFLYAADSADSGVDPDFAPAGWKFQGFKVRSFVAVHPTTYGDPSLPRGESRYAAEQILMSGQRDHWATFAKATFPLYIAAFLATASLLFDFGGRMGVLGTSLFAVVLNYLSIDNVVGPHDGLVLLDQLHVLGLALIVAVTLWTVMTQRRAHKGEDLHALRRKDERFALFAVGGFLLANAAAVGLAVAGV